MNSAAKLIKSKNTVKLRRPMSQLGDLGSGAGKGGGDGGSIRASGGGFGRRQAAREEEYFHKMQREQLSKLKHEHTDETTLHEQQIKTNQEANNRHKSKVEKIQYPE